MKRLVFAIVALLTVVGHLFLYQETFQEKKRLEEAARAAKYVFPGEFTQAAVLDFKGLAADFQLLHAIFFIGEKLENNKPISSLEWEYFINLIQVITDLDPYFYDPYYFASNLLAWSPDGKQKEAIEILKKAQKFRPNDFRIPFYIGFIYFYFLNDLEKGAEYISQAAKYPGAPQHLGTLASRLAFYAGDYRFSIALLRDFVEEARNEQIRSWYQKRLKALEGALYLEAGAVRFKKEYGKFPSSLQELKNRGIVETIPKDPYGGEYYIQGNGRVFSTSKFAETKE